MAEKKKMKTASRKAKGRRLQDRVVKDLRKLVAPLGLQDDDIKPAIMGTSGVDVLLSPAALAVLPLSIECKNVERLQVVPTFLTHYYKYEKKNTLKLLVHSKNHVYPMVTLRLEDFMQLVELALSKLDAFSQPKEAGDKRTEGK